MLIFDFNYSLKVVIIKIASKSFPVLYVPRPLVYSQLAFSCYYHERKQYFLFHLIVRLFRKLEHLYLEFYIVLFIYFWLCWVSVTLHRLSLVAANGSCSSVVQASHCSSFSLQSWALEHRLSSWQHTDLLVAPRNVESSQTRD